MAWTQTDLDRIDAAIAAGVRVVKFQDREIEYQSMTDLRQARTDIANALATTGGTPTVRMVRIYTQNGW